MALYEIIRSAAAKVHHMRRSPTVMIINYYCHHDEVFKFKMKHSYNGHHLDYGQYKTICMVTLNEEMSHYLEA